VLALLEAGIDPQVRDGRQRTLLHLLHLLDHQTLLPMLLRAGLDLEARDQHERTPLHVAAGEGPADLVHALLDAGARIDVADEYRIGLPDLIVWRGRMKELGFLKDAVERDYPDLAARRKYSRLGW
jgi:ankyrin repeat protein